MSSLILRYKHINYNEKITPEDFEANLRTLQKEGFAPINLSNIYEYISNGKNPPKKTVHITFDGGYADNFIYAYPILKKYGYFATIFVVAGKVVGNLKRATYNELISMNMAHEVNNLLEKSKYISWEELKELVNSGMFEIGSHSYNHKACFSSKKLVKFNNTGTIEWLYDLTEDKRLGIPVFEKKWDCATRCIRDDINLRNHLADFVSRQDGMLFFRNKNYKRILTNEIKKYAKKNRINFETENEEKRAARIKQEIHESKTMIENNLNIKANFFCYPWGDYDSISIEEIKKAEYKGALTLNVGLNTKNTNPYLMNRIKVGSGNWLKKRIGIYGNEFINSIYSKIRYKI